MHTFLPPKILRSLTNHGGRRGIRVFCVVECSLFEGCFRFLPFRTRRLPGETATRTITIFPYSFYGISVISNNSRKRYLPRLTHCVRRKRLVSQPPFVHHTSFRTRSCHFLDFRPNGRETAETPRVPARDLETRKPGGPCRDLHPAPVATHDVPSSPALPKQNGNP